MSDDPRPAPFIDLEHRFACVSGVPLFRDVAEEGRYRIAERVVTRRVDRGETVYGPGDRPGLQVLHAGRLKATRLTDGGREQLLRVLRPGEFTGEYSLLSSLPATLTVRAAEDSVVCSLPRAHMEELLAAHPEVSRAMLTTLATRLDEVESQVTGITSQSVRRRLAEYLMDVLPVGRAARLPMSKKDLASYLGTTPETVSRRLRGLADDGLIELGARNSVAVLDPAGLAAVED